MSITISYQLNQDDYYEFYHYTSWKATWNKKKKIKYFLQAFLVGAIVIVALVYSFERKTPESIIGSVVIFFIIYTILLLIMIKDGYRRTARRIYEDPKNANLFLRTELRFDETGISGKDGLSETHISWAAIVRSSSTPKHYFLFFSDLNALTIPKRIFISTTEKESFEKILSQYLPLQTKLASLDK